MKRLLCIVGGMNAGGAETFLMKIYRNLDKEKYQMDFCVSKHQKGFYDDEIISLGGKIIYTTPKTKNPLASFLSIYKIVKNNNYKYVMRISQHSLSAIDLLAAKIGGAKVRVFRSSNSNTTKGGIDLILHQFFGFLPRTVANVKIAPSLPAAEFMFGKKCIQKGDILFLNNGIPLEEYTFDADARREVRNELELDDQFLLGHIGRFAAQKNHKKLLDIFAEVLKVEPKTHLMLVGEGELEDSIREAATKMKLADRIHFMGVRRDIPKLLSAMDVFVFPSLYEGMPNTVIEAQANGVPCIISDTITAEAKICCNVKMISLDKIIEWRNEIFNTKRIYSLTNQDVLRKNGYDIRNVVNGFVNAVYEK